MTANTRRLAYAAAIATAAALAARWVDHQHCRFANQTDTEQDTP